MPKAGGIGKVPGPRSMLCLCCPNNVLLHGLPNITALSGGLADGEHRVVHHGGAGEMPLCPWGVCGAPASWLWPGFGLIPVILGRPEWLMRMALARAAGLLYGLPCALDGNIHFCPFQRRGEVDRDDQLSWKLWT